MDNYKLDIDNVENNVIPSMQTELNNLTASYDNMKTIIKSINTADNMELEAGDACVEEFEKNTLADMDELVKIVTNYKDHLVKTCSNARENDKNMASIIRG